MRTFLFSISVSLCGVAISATPALADHVAVTTTADVVAIDGACSLREAIDVFNTEHDTADCPLASDADPSSILLPAGTYTLAGAAGDDANTSGDLDVRTNLVIAGAGAEQTILGGADADRVFDAITPRLELRTLSLVHGAGDGALVRAQSLVLDGVWLRDTTGAASIVIASSLELTRSAVLDTRVTGATIDAGSTAVNAATLAGNVAATLILASGNLTIENATITGNTTTRLLYGTGARSQCEFSTIVDNTGALFERSLRFHHVIVGGNGSCATPAQSGGVNVLADAAATSCLAPLPQGDVVGVAPRLAPLGMYGGPTPTRKPTLSSPARDMYPCPYGAVVDQRGVARPQFGLCDTGAVELAPVLASAIPEPAGARCARGGVALVLGEDRDASDVLDTGEIAYTTYACAPGSTSLTVAVEPLGTHCTRGGQRIAAGVDGDADGVLAPEEITSAAYLCALPSSLAVASHEPAGPRCATGGTRIDAGIDDDGDGALAPVEVRSTAIACADLLPGDVATTEPPGEHCAAGGTRIDHGTDSDGDGEIAPSEITSTTYVCADADGLVTVTPEPAGEHCAAGGQRIDTGHDTDANGLLDPSEVAGTTYACAEPAAGCSTGGRGSWGVLLVVACAALVYRRRRAALVPACLAVLGLPALAHANNVTVTTTADVVAADGACSLREALRVVDRGEQVADCTSIADPEPIVTLPAGTFTLTGAPGDDANASGDLDITYTLTLRGAGPELTILDAAGADRVIDSTAPALSLVGLTLRGGVGDGAAVRARQTRLRLDHVHLLQCTGGNTVVIAAYAWIETTLVLGAQATNTVIVAPSLNVFDSTLAGNVAPSLLVVADALQVERTTVAGNTTTQVFSGPNASSVMRFATITDNGGALRDAFRSFTVEYSIIAGNGGCSPAPSSAVYSLLADDAAQLCVRDLGTNRLFAPANLAPLDYYGGPTPTRRPLPASRARDAAPCPSSATVDQRGVTRPRFGWCDLGAVEAAPFATRAVVEAAGPRCARGGVALQRGEDRDADGSLDDAEVATSVYACSTPATLVSLVAGGAGAQCSRGGDRIDAGSDLDGDRVLSSAEVVSTAYVCHEPTALALVIESPADAHCALGGLALVAGSDGDEDGALEPAEVRSTAYLCRAAVELDVASDEPAGEHCPAGGTRIEHGIDADGDGALQVGEIASVTYACTATDELVTVTVEPSGSHCEAGGERVDTGRDLDGDDALDPEEIDDTAYACDEPSSGCAAGGSAGSGSALAFGLLALVRRRRRV